MNMYKLKSKFPFRCCGSIYLNSSILELKEQVVFHSCSQKQQPASSACFDLEWQVEGVDILEGLYGAEAVPKVGLWEENERCVRFAFKEI